MMLKRTPLYPFLFAAYPALALAAHNIHEIAVRDILRPLVISLLLAGVVLALARLLLRDWDRAPLVSAWLLLLFFTYGQAYAELKGISMGGLLPFRHRTLGPLWMLVTGVGIYWLGWKVKSPRSATPWLNLLAAFLLIYPVFTMGSNGVEQAIADSRGYRARVQAASSGVVRRDIYYIILDGYARQDALMKEVGYDNGGFIDALKARGFFVAECSQSNYARTELSLPSSLNYDYIDDLGLKTQEGLSAFIKHGALRAFLESRGYKTVAFPTGFSWTEWTDADIYPLPEYKSALPTEFENLVLSTSLLRIPLDFGMLDFATESTADRYRARVRSTLENLKRIPKDPDPTFTFAHLVIPHYPYLFGPNGEEVDNSNEGQWSIVGYRDQVIFINREILKVIDTILTDSDTPPIIVIQGDHGAPAQIGTAALRMRILNAYYLPGSETALYPSISPVNTFRLILDSYFEQNIPLLPDHSFYSEYSRPFYLKPIPNSCPGQ